MVNGSCKSCSSGCTNCYGTANNCTQCYAGAYLFNGTCQKCNTDINFCTSCVLNVSNFICLSCPVSMGLWNNQCH